MRVLDETHGLDGRGRSHAGPRRVWQGGGDALVSLLRRVRGGHGARQAGALVRDARRPDVAGPARRAADLQPSPSRAPSTPLAHDFAMRQLTPLRSRLAALPARSPRAAGRPRRVLARALARPGAASEVALVHRILSEGFRRDPARVDETERRVRAAPASRRNLVLRAPPRPAERPAGDRALLSLRAPRAPSPCPG